MVAHLLWEQVGISLSGKHLAELSGVFSQGCDLTSLGTALAPLQGDGSVLQGRATGNSDGVVSAMADEFLFAAVAAGRGAFDLVLVHGLTGTPVETWTVPAPGEDGETYWPRWLAQDTQANVYALGYPASVFAHWAKQEMSLFERSKAALEQMASYGIGTRPIGFISHSLGGLLVKQMLRTAADSPDAGWRAIVESCRLVAFLATPHTGASLASVLQFITPRLVSGHMELLRAGGSQLDELNEAYRRLADLRNIRTLACYEKYKTKNAALIVTKESADPGIPDAVPIPFDADHLSICKPPDRNAPIYRSVLRRVGQCFPIVEDDVTPFALDGYEDAATRDRRDLQQKLIDAGREHEYSFANERQNKFAQRYLRFGLHTAGRTANEELLAAVEQRFTMHVFHGRICQGASREEVDDAIQKHVVEPICGQQYGGVIANAVTVMSALYYLADRCYIRWDGP